MALNWPGDCYRMGFNNGITANGDILGKIRQSSKSQIMKINQVFSLRCYWCETLNTLTNLTLDTLSSTRECHYGW